MEVCYYNWTEACCYKTKDLKPGQAPVAEENKAAAQCVNRFCGSQYTPGNPFAFPPGSLVEDAGWMACIKTAAGGRPNSPAGGLDLTPSQTKEENCKKCCVEKAAFVTDYWTPPYNCLSDEYRQHVVDTTTADLKECNKECTKYFSPNLPKLSPSPVASPGASR